MTSRWWARLGRRVLPRRSPRPAVVSRPRGYVLVGTVWRGGDHEPAPGTVVVDAGGRIAAIGPGTEHVPADLPVVRAAWIGPAPADVHVHLGAGDDLLAAMRRGGVALVRDLGAARPVRAAAGDVVLAAPLLTTSRSEDDDEIVRWHIRQLVRGGVTVGSVDLAAGPTAVGLAVRAAHDEGLPVVARALTVDMVGRALDAGVDELSQTPVERLPEALVERIAATGIGVVSTLQAFFSAGVGRDAAVNAAALVRAGVPMRYGTDASGSAAVRGEVPRGGVDPRELDRIAAAGLGRLGALRSATDVAAGAAGVSGYAGLLVVARCADLVGLGADPLVEPLAWHTPRLVVVGGRIVGGADPLARAGGDAA